MAVSLAVVFWRGLGLWVLRDPRTRIEDVHDQCARCHAPLEQLWQMCPYCATPVEPLQNDPTRP